MFLDSLTFEESKELANEGETDETSDLQHLIIMENINKAITFAKVVERFFGKDPQFTLEELREKTIEETVETAEKNSRVFKHQTVAFNTDYMINMCVSLGYFLEVATNE